MILITGATGLIGRLLVTILSAEGVKIRAVTRTPATAKLPAEVEVVAGDPSRPDTIAAALDGVTSLFLNPRAVDTAAAPLLALARQRGVRKVVALSAMNVEDDEDRQPSRQRGDYNRETEIASVESGLGWVSLRPSMFASNAIGLWADPVRAGNVIKLPYPKAAWAPLHDNDLAEIAARALLADDLLGTRPRLTGPESLTNEEMIAMIGAAIGRPLRSEQVSPAESEKHLLAKGFPAGFIASLGALQAEFSTHPAVLTSDAADILGRPPRTFATWAEDNAAAFTTAPESIR
jgi:uncharacterized protein YbjT (DUF2867 family)